MSDDDSDDWEEKKKLWEQRLSSGAPIMQVHIDQPMTVFKGAGGELVVDTVTYELVGFDHLGTVRVTMSPAAVENLRWVFANLEKTSEGFSAEEKTPRTN